MRIICWKGLCATAILAASYAQATNLSLGLSSSESRNFTEENRVFFAQAIVTDAIAEQKSRDSTSKSLEYEGVKPKTQVISAQVAHPVSEQCQTCSTYFQYSSDAIKEISAKNSNERMSNEELVKWDETAADLSRNNPSADIYRMYAYLYTAQKDAAFLSYQSHGQFMGSLGLVSAKVLQLFFPSVPTVEADEYSKYLAQVVFAKIKERFDDESKEIRSYPLAENDPKLKDLPKPYLGLKIASWKPWLLNDPKQFMPKQPPSQNDSYWKQQAEVVKKISENCTEKQLKAAKFWAREAGPKSGDWMVIANEYMFSRHVPFSKIVCIRSILAEAGIDIDIAVFHAKYTYVIKRPSAIDPTICPHIRLPTHPSYPSAHSTESAANATILSSYFPEEKEYWFQVAEEAGQSRIWAGIHYPIDHQGGWALGIELGNAILQSTKLCCESS